MITPGLRQTTVLYLEPKRAATTVGCVLGALVFTAAGIAAVSFRDDLTQGFGSPKTPAISESVVWIAAGVAGLLVVALLVGAIVNGRRWHTANTVKRLSEDPRLGPTFPDTTMAPLSRRSAVVPALDVRFVKPQRLRRPPVRLRRVTPQTNIIGRRPLRIAYLRVFENQPRMRTFIEGAWREFGYIYFLRSAWAVTPAELKAARRSGDLAGLFVTSRDRLVLELDERPDRPNPKGRYRFRRIGAKTIRVRDRYGSYPVRPVLCHGSYWKAAVDVLLERADLVALDLSGYTQKNAGTRYELQRVVDRVAVERVVFLADSRSKRKFLAAEVQQAWEQMAPSSPNAVNELKTAIIAVTDYYRASQQSQGPPGPGGQAQTTQVRYRLVAKRRQTRRLVAMAQERVDALV